jgi:hypothetical protein
MDNTPAFPANHFDLGATEHGMTLRDYFAAKAMQAMMSRPEHAHFAGSSHYAEASYVMADAMMKARK